MSKKKKFNFQLQTLINNPGTAFVSSYLALACLGSVLLMLPWSTQSEHFSWIDSFFTATSALCVTGLTVVDTGTTFTVFGQVIILLLIQFGGIGIMTFAAWVFVATGWRISMLQRSFIQDTYTSDPTINIKRLVGFIIIFALITELAGTLFLMTAWWNDFSPWKNFYFALFHSISAFCNAGFALFPDSFAGYYNNVLLNITVAMLIVIGGIGFPVVFELLSLIKKPARNRISLHTRVVLQTTLILVLAGMIFFWFIEQDSYMSGMTFSEKLLVSFFQSVTSRTAGFSTINFDLLSNATLLIFILLMFVGASPGSCGGGIKTTSAAALMIVLWNRLSGRETNRIYRSTLTALTVSRTLSIFILSILFIVTILCALLISQLGDLSHEQSRGLFLEYLFETVSAFGTVGLSMGATSKIDTVGKLLITGTMLVGRVGILTVVYLFARQKAAPRYQYAEENIMIG